MVIYHTDVFQLYSCFAGILFVFPQLFLVEFVLNIQLKCEIGCFLFKKSLGLFPFGIQVLIPCFYVSDKWSFCNESLKL